VKWRESDLIRHDVVSFVSEPNVVLPEERKSVSFVAVDCRLKKVRPGVNAVVSNQNWHGTHPPRGVIGSFALSSLMPEGISRSQRVNPVPAAFIFDRGSWGPVFIADLIKVPRLLIVNVNRYAAPGLLGAINLCNRGQRCSHHRRVSLSRDRQHLHRVFSYLPKLSIRYPLRRRVRFIWRSSINSCRRVVPRNGRIVRQDSELAINLWHTCWLYFGNNILNYVAIL